jgi:hypothetical protein
MKSLLLKFHATKRPSRRLTCFIHVMWTWSLLSTRGCSQSLRIWTNWAGMSGINNTLVHLQRQHSELHRDSLFDRPERHAVPCTVSSMIGVMSGALGHLRTPVPDGNTLLAQFTGSRATRIWLCDSAVYSHQAPYSGATSHRTSRPPKADVNIAVRRLAVTC